MRQLYALSVVKSTMEGIAAAVALMREMGLPASDQKG